jgi:hypothetical protein
VSSCALARTRCALPLVARDTAGDRERARGAVDGDRRPSRALEAGREPERAGEAGRGRGRRVAQRRDGRLDDRRGLPREAGRDEDLRATFDVTP